MKRARVLLGVILFTDRPTVGRGAASRFVTVVTSSVASVVTSFADRKHGCAPVVVFAVCLLGALACAVESCAILLA